MASLDWSDIKPMDKKGSGGKSSGSSDLFMALPDGKHQVRLVGKPIAIYTAWIKGQKYIVPENYVDRVRQYGVEPRLKYAICCFDRADTEKGITRLKILEKGNSIFSFFRTYFEDILDENGKNVDPGGTKGPDWKITVSVPEGKDAQRRTTYSIMPIRPVAFTEKEIEMLTRSNDPEKWKEKPFGERGKIKLEQFYKIDDAAQKIEELLVELSGMKGSPSPSVGNTVAKDDDDDEGESLDALIEGTQTASSPSKPAASASEEDLSKILDTF